MPLETIKNESEYLGSLTSEEAYALVPEQIDEIINNERPR